MKFNVTGNRIFFAGLYTYVMNMLQLYFRQFKIKGAENIPKNSSIILTPNHQNAFMDAITPIYNFGAGNQLSFLVRASIFGNKYGDWFLKNLNIMPVYREIDGVDIIDKNQIIFENCVWLLERKRILTLFPEGTHHVKKKLLPLKKGVSRIAFTAEERHNYSLNTVIVPVGIYYTRLSDYGGNLLIQLGEPIYIKDYIELYKQNPNKAHALIKSELTKRMKPLMIDIENLEYYDCIDLCREMVTNEKRINTVIDEFKNSKIVIEKIHRLIEKDEESSVLLKSLTERYSDFLKKNNFRDKIFANNNSSFNLIDFILLLLISPLGIYGWVNNYLAFHIPVWLADKFIKDKGFISSIKSAFAMLSFPVLYLVQSLLVALITWNSWMGLLYLGTLPISFFIGLAWRRKVKKLDAQIRVAKMKSTDEFEEAMTWRKEITIMLNSL